METVSSDCAGGDIVCCGIGGRIARWAAESSWQLVSASTFSVEASC